MGDFRIVVEGVGNHGCGRDTKPGEPIKRCSNTGCVDCTAIALVSWLQRGGAIVAKAELQHWPVPGAAGCERSANPGPIDDLLTNLRKGSFGG